MFGLKKCCVEKTRSTTKCDIVVTYKNYCSNINALAGTLLESTKGDVRIEVSVTTVFVLGIKVSDADGEVVDLLLCGFCFPV